MSHKTAVYDLGAMGLGRTASRGAAGLASTARWRSPRPRQSAEDGAWFDLPGTLSLFIPGSGHIWRGELTWGLFYMSALAFLAAFSWSVSVSLERIIETMRLLGLPHGPAVWLLGWNFILAGGLYVANVWTVGRSGPEPGPLHPALPGAASAVVPGWGQVLNGSRLRACLFVGGLWLVGAAWLLHTAEVAGQLRSLGLYVPSSLQLFTNSLVRITLPIVIWSLAVYDAAMCATVRRKS